MLTRQTLCRDIDALGLSGCCVSAHAAMRTFGPIEGGVQTLIDAFLDCGCTLLTPAFCYNYQVPYATTPARNAWDYANPGKDAGVGKIFTPDCDDIYQTGLGALPAFVVRQAGRARGNNPINSFAAVGPMARALVAAQTPMDVYAPFEALLRADGYIVLMGVGLTRMTALHYAEQLSGRVPFIRWANGADGTPIEVSTGGCSDGFDCFEDVLAPIERHARVGECLWRIFPAREAILRCAQALREDPVQSHCANPDCALCADAIAGGPVRG